MSKFSIFCLLQQEHHHDGSSLVVFPELQNKKFHGSPHNLVSTTPTSTFLSCIINRKRASSSSIWAVSQINVNPTFPWTKAKFLWTVNSASLQYGPSFSFFWHDESVRAASTSVLDVPILLDSRQLAKSSLVNRSYLF